MRALTLREKVIVGIGAAVVVIFVYLFALLLPARRTVGSLVRQQAQAQEQLDQAKLMYAEAITARQQIVRLKKESSDLMFPAADVQSGTVSEIERLSKELKVTVTSIRPGNAEAADGSTRYPTVFKVEAELGPIVRLLYELEQPSRRLWVEGVEITSARQAGTALSATIYAAAYARSRKSEAVNAKV